jgi:hypothetical protein
LTHRNNEYVFCIAVPEITVPRLLIHRSTQTHGRKELSNGVTNTKQTDVLTLLSKCSSKLCQQLKRNVKESERRGLETVLQNVNMTSVCEATYMLNPYFSNNYIMNATVYVLPRIYFFVPAMYQNKLMCSKFSNVANMS